jgi:hypothetical protein
LAKFVAGARLIALFCPALLGFAIAIYKAKLGSVDATHSSFKSGMAEHVCNALLSPGVPAYLLYVDTHTGGGSMASLLSLPIIPVTWVLFFIGNKWVSKSSTPEL